MGKRHVFVACRGRDAEGHDVLGSELRILVHLIRDRGANRVSVSPESCPCSTGPRRQWCRATTVGNPEIKTGIMCPFHFNFPGAALVPGWTMPEELATAVRQLWEEGTT